MRKILGLDLGVASIGWALISETEEKREILGMGSRIIPLSTDEKDEFSSGNKISKNQKRTLKRTQRKGYDRYQLRRKYLTEALLSHKMFDETQFQLKPVELWGLRAKAVTEMISLTELGRVLYHLNQKRGYKSSRSDENQDKKDSEYVAEVKGRYELLKAEGLTIGQKFYGELLKNQYYRIKQQVFPREAYVEEFDRIMSNQQHYFPEVLTNEFIGKLRNEIIYYQRRLKSQKGLVGVCELESFARKTKDGREIVTGPKVAPRSSPVAQVCKLWETINTIRIKDKYGNDFTISIEKKQEIFQYLDNNERLSLPQLFKILGISRNEGYYGNKQLERGLQGNTTKTELLKILEPESPWLTFELSEEILTESGYIYDRKTGEVLKEEQRKIISSNIEHQPLYRLWHTIYSIADTDECASALIKNFSLDPDSAARLSAIDFKRLGFSNKSVKAIRKLLPYLMQGYVYSDASSLAGYTHANSITADENLKRKLLNSIPLLPKNSLRQPVVEKILNQMINVVNAIMAKYGRPDEIRIELARELKQSREERNETFAKIKKTERENENIRKRLQEEYGIRASRNNVIKWRLFHEINNEDSKINATCIYCGQPFSLTDALRGNSIDVEHIIPRSLLFDDSQANKTLSHRACNAEKGNRTAFDFMQQKGEIALKQYVERVNHLYQNKLIQKPKRDKLLTTEQKIPKDFIQRQLRETQYVSKKAREILQQACHLVWSTSGSVTEYLRRIWGWDDVLMNLQLPQYRALGLTEWVDWETNDGHRHKKETIKGWSKRDDHRHHAIDALVVACTKQGFIQRINTLNSQHNRDEMFSAIEKQGAKLKVKRNLLEEYLLMQKPFTTRDVEEKAAGILVSFKQGKKVATRGRRLIKKNGRKIIAQKDIIVPRGALCEESVYGKIKTMEKVPAKNLFYRPELIVKQYIRELVEDRMRHHDNDPRKAAQSLKKDPIWLDSGRTVLLEWATCYKEEYVIKYPIDSIKPKDVEFIIDERLRELVRQRLELYGNKEKEAFKEPLYFSEEHKIPVRTVRMRTGLGSLEPLAKNASGEFYSYTKPGNNHHLAIYQDGEGKKQVHICTFWHAVERKKFGLPVVINDPASVWDKLLDKAETLPQEFLNKLPEHDWKLVMSFQQNEMFLLELPEDLQATPISSISSSMLSNHLYRLQKLSIISTGAINIWFRKHTETQLIDTADAQKAKRFYNIQSINALEKIQPIKVNLSNLGEIKITSY